MKKTQFLCVCAGIILDGGVKHDVSPSEPCSLGRAGKAAGLGRRPQ